MLNLDDIVSNNKSYLERNDWPFRFWQVLVKQTLYYI